MPTFLSDPPQALLLLLAVVAIVAAVPLARNQDRRSLFVFLGCLAPLLLLLLLDRLVESPREEASRKVRAMADAATAADGARFVEHLSASFRIGPADREKVRNSPAWGLVRQYQARIAVWGLDASDAESKGPNEIVVGFYAKAQTPSNEGLIRYCRATFVRDPDGQFRARGIEFFTPGMNGRTPDPIPGFP